MFLTELQPGVNRLPRGGYVVPTSAGYIQFGAPPETIKDTMSLPKQVPQIFVLPGELFSVEKGIAVAELEFPIYFNHFLKQKKTYILGTEEQRDRLKVVLQESVFGPEAVDLKSEYPEGDQSRYFPDLKAEMNYFRGERKLEDLVTFGIFRHERMKVNDVVIVRHSGENFQVYDKGELVATVPWRIEYQMKYDIGAGLKEAFEPPELGITCLGPSHGFDPQDNTSGFILWINRRGIMVDPPVNSTEWLSDSNVNPKYINHVILTHCHADHDAGTFQKILEEYTITIHTTETVMDSFIRKYHALTKIPIARLYELFEFNPVQVDSAVYIEGAEFLFNYTLHSIPTLGFRCHFRNQSFLYTSDHLNCPESFDKMYEQGIFTPGRYEFLRNFPWEYNIIYHEAGIPPLHTPVSYLASLPREIQEKITVYHIAQKDFPEDSYLHLAHFGMENTLYPPIDPPKFPKAYAILDVLANIDIFSDLHISKAKEFLDIVQEEYFERDERIIHKGDQGEKFYIILSGNIRVEGASHGIEKSFGTYEYFGEASLVTGELRSANIVAQTEVHALTINKDRFLHFIRGTSLEKSLSRLAAIRESDSWSVLSDSAVFSAMTSTQKTQLESILHYTKVPAGHEIVMRFKPSDKGYIVIGGEVELSGNGCDGQRLKRGDFVGEIFSLQKGYPSPFSAKAVSECELFEIRAKDLTNFIKKNPGVYMRLMKGTVQLRG